MKERLLYLLIGILIVTGCVIERVKHFLAVLLMLAFHEFFNESPYRILIRNSEFVLVSNHP